jgi:hypothetical protein
MRYPYKYAMPVDPRVLKNDFESKGLDAIPHILSMLKEITPHDAKVNPLMRRVDDALKELWFKVDANVGINLRDREKLIPLFEEYARIFKKDAEYHNVAYRGVNLPRIYATSLSDYIDPTKEIDINDYPEQKEILENLAYGLRSWSQQIDDAITWGMSDKGYKADKVVFTCHNPNVVLDCNSYFKSFNYLRAPFDEDELICYLENPKVIKTTKKGSFWYVDVIE